MSDDEILYHYTDAVGLLGILTPIVMPEIWQGEMSARASLTLHAADVRYLNDREELTFGGTILAELLRKRAADALLPAETVTGMQALAEEIEGGKLTIDWGTHRSPIAVHAACFCEDGDLLSQWRGYGANGGGYAIGFRKKVLESFTVRFQSTLAGVMPMLVKIAYGEAAATSGLEAFVNDVAVGTSNFRNGGPSDFLRQLSLHVIAKTKHGAFSAESEWRLLSDTSGYDFTEFRPGRTGLVPYVEFCVNPKGLDSATRNPKPGEMERPAIARLVVGPGPDQPLRVAAVERLLLKHGHNPDVVTVSAVPYRG